VLALNEAFRTTNQCGNFRHDDAFPANAVNRSLGFIEFGCFAQDGD
jgi:hypothetical protein